MEYLPTKLSHFWGVGKYSIHGASWFWLLATFSLVLRFITNASRFIFWLDESNQWPFQDPKVEVPTIYKAYIRPIIRGYPIDLYNLLLLKAPELWSICGFKKLIRHRAIGEYPRISC